jgi:hypothetical protein
MLAVDLWRVKIIHFKENLFIEELWSEDLCQIWMLVGCLIEWIAIVHGVVSIIWLPFVDGDKGVTEYFFSIDTDQSSIHVVCDSTTIVAISNQTLNGWPWDRIFLIE